MDAQGGNIVRLFLTPQKLVYIYNWLFDVKPLAQELNLVQQLQPLHLALEEGNQAMQWIQSIARGISVKGVLQGAITAMAQEEIPELRREVLLG